MKKGRLSEDQMVRILREADKAPVAEAASRHGVSEASIYTWRKKYGELDVSDVRHLKKLEQENARLKKLLAERGLEIGGHEQDESKKAVAASAHRQLVAYGQRRGLPQRRCCKLCSLALCASSSVTAGHQGRSGADDDAPIVTRVSSVRLPPLRHPVAPRRVFDEF